MRLTFFLSLFFLIESCSAQQLLLLPEQNPNELHWNPVFMQRNSIAQIHGDISVKREGQRIINKPEKYLYKFDQAGQTAYRNTSYGKPGTGIDTTFVQFEYDENGKLLRELSTDVGGHFEKVNTYDSTGLLATQTYGRVANLNTNRYDLKPGERTEISDERYRYERSEKLLKKTYYNDRELPFREVRFHYDDDGYLMQIEHISLMSRKRRIEQFTYDDKGRLKQRLKHSDTGKPSKRTVYTYDSVNNIVKREVFIGQTQTIHEEYLYDLNSGLLDARLTKDLETGVIRIVKYAHFYH